MAERASQLLEWLLSIPDWAVYVLVGVSAALENIIPPIPADVVVVVGGVLAGAGGASALLLFLAVLIGNVGSAMLVYLAGRRYGSRFFDGRIGQFVLAPRQLEKLSAAYQKYGIPIIFVSRFLPVFRPVVPAFAGVSQLGALATALPIALASAIWYGALVYVGSTAGSNWEEVLAGLERLGTWLWLVAAVLILGVLVIWRRTRRQSADDR